MEGGGKVVEEVEDMQVVEEVGEVQEMEGGGVPDGGYGWLVVLGSVLQLVFAAPLLNMFGLLFGPKFAACGTAPAEQATVFSLFLVTWSVATLLVGPLVKVVGVRAVAAIGTTTLVCGLVVTALAGTTLQLGVGVSLLLGAAFGLSNVNCLLIVNSWFKRNVGLALSVMNACVCLGKMGVPQVVVALMARFPTEQVLLAYAALCCTGYTGALLLRPVRPPLPRPKDQLDALGVGEELLQGKVLEDGKQLQKAQENSFLSFIHLIKWRLLLDPKFLLVAGGATLTFNCVLTFLSLVRRVAAERGLGVEETASLLSLLGLVEMVGMPLHGLLGDRLPLHRLTAAPRRLLFASSALCIALLLSLLTLTATFLTTAVVMALVAFFWGGLTLNISIVLAEAFPADLSSALGLSNLIRAVEAPMVGALVGGLTQGTGDLTMALHALTALMALSMLLWALLPSKSSECQFL